MSKREFTFIIVNLPFCFFLIVALIVFDQALNYSFSSWNPGITATSIYISIIILGLDFILIALFKIFTIKMILLTLLEYAITFLTLFFSSFNRMCIS